MKNIWDSNYQHRKTNNTRIGTKKQAWFLEVNSKINKSFPWIKGKKGNPKKINDVRNENRDITTKRGGSSRKYKRLLCTHLKI